MRLTPAAHRALGVGMLLPALFFLLPHPGALAEAKAAKPAPRRAAAKDRKAEPKTPAPASAGACTHVVRRGDTVSRLASQYKVSQRAIASANHLGAVGAVKVGQRIEIPGCKVAIAKTRRAPEPAPIDSGPGELLARVGPRRVPTRLFVAVPDFDGTVADFRWPIEGAILSGFGPRSGGWHAGVDIKGERGAPIRAAAPGIVAFSGAERFYGRMVKIEHSSGFTTIYAHNLENLVQVGDRVNGGTVIATVGRTGHASAYHVHFEIRRDDTAYNPVHLLEPRDGPMLVSNSEFPLEEEFGP